MVTEKNEIQAIINLINKDGEQLTQEEIAGYIDTIERSRLKDNNPSNPPVYNWTSEAEIDEVYAELTKIIKIWPTDKKF